MSKTVLVVDDERIIQELLKRWLEMEGYETCTASDGFEGLSQFHARRPHLVVTDILMPGMDGRELCKKIRETSDVPIIIISGLGNLEEEKKRIQGMDLRIDAFFSKPISMDEFTETVRALLGRLSTPASDYAACSQGHPRPGPRLL